MYKLVPVSCFTLRRVYHYCYVAVSNQHYVVTMTFSPSTSVNRVSFSVIQSAEIPL